MEEAVLYNYIAQHSSARPEVFEWIRRQTFLRTNHIRMLSGEPQGAFLTMLTRAMGVRRAIEVGTFTGYASVSIALGLPPEGHLDTLERNDELEDIIRGALERASVEDKVSVHFGNALDTLAALSAQFGGTSPAAASSCLGDTSPEATFQPYDLAYIDADKREYCAYFEALLPLMRPGAVILADNTLWDGKVFDELCHDAQTGEIRRFNDMVCKDRRVEAFILPIRDGLTVITKK